MTHGFVYFFLLAFDAPLELQQYWEGEYAEIDVASSKISVLERNGYSPIGHFVLPEHCWLENYYWPMQSSFQDFLNRNSNSKEARAIVDAENREIELYEKYKTYYSYSYILQESSINKGRNNCINFDW